MAYGSRLLPTTMRRALSSKINLNQLQRLRISKIDFISIPMLMFVYILILFNIYRTTLQYEVAHKTVATLFNNKTIEYLIKEETMCSSRGFDILIGVHSSPQNIHKRNAIRSSFGAFKIIRDQTIQVIFIVGMTTNKTLDRSLQRESDDYRDIIQSKFIDTYYNLTLKHVALLNWVDIYCRNVSYFVKIDDDTLIDIFHLEYFLRTYEMKSDLYCKSIDAPVFRDGKWKVTKEEYPNDYYPTYCEGFAYILTNVKKLSQMVMYALQEKFFWIDDVLLLGTIRHKLKMTLEGFPVNFGYSNMNESSRNDSMDFIFFRDDDNKNNKVLWGDIWNSIVLNSVDLYS